LAHLQFQDQHDVSGEVEIVPHVARLQVRVEDSDAEVFQALRVVREVTDEAGEQADVRGVDFSGGESLLDGGFDDAEAASAGVEERLAHAHDLLGDVVAGTARDDTEEDGVGLNHLGWSGRQGLRLLLTSGSAGCRVG